MKEEKRLYDRVFLMCSDTAQKIIADEESHVLLGSASIYLKSVLEYQFKLNFKDRFTKDVRKVW